MTVRLRSGAKSTAEILGRLTLSRQGGASRTSPGIIIAAASAFVVAFLWAATHLPSLGTPDCQLFILSGIIGSPALLLLSAAEYDISVRMLSYQVTFLGALRVSVLSSVANLLPVPGSLVVRTQALKALGASYARGASSTLVVGAGWVGTTALVVGVIEAVGGHAVAGAILLAFGCLGLAGTTLLLLLYVDSRGAAVRLLMRIVGVETAFVAVGALRYFLVLRGLNVDVQPSQAAALTFAGVITSLVGVVPQGLGVKELAVAAISPLVGLPISVGLVAAATIRVMDLAVDAPLAVLILHLSSRKQAVIHGGGKLHVLE